MTTTDLADRVAEVDVRQRATLETTPRTRSVFDAVKAQESEFLKAFPKGMDAQRFVRLALTSLRTVPHLLECSETSVMAGFMQAAQLGLEIDQVRGQAFLIPRWNSKLKSYEATFQLGYRGLIDIAGRSGVKVSVREVHERDEFHYEDGLAPVLRHIPKLDGDRGPVIALFSVARFIDGSDPEFLVMSLAEVDEVGEQFGPRNRDGRLIGPWADPKSKPGMRRKTLARRVLNYVPMPVEVEDAMRADESVAQPVPVENTAQRAAELPPPGDAAAPPVSPGRDADDASPAAEPSIQERARDLTLELAEEAWPAWEAYRKKHVLVPDPLGWSDTQAEGVIAFCETPLEEEGDDGTTGER